MGITTGSPEETKVSSGLPVVMQIQCHNLLYRYNTNEMQKLYLKCVVVVVVETIMFWRKMLFRALYLSLALPLSRPLSICLTLSVSFCLCISVSASVSLSVCMRLSVSHSVSKPLEQFLDHSQIEHDVLKSKTVDILTMPVIRG